MANMQNICREWEEIPPRNGVWEGFFRGQVPCPCVEDLLLPPSLWIIYHGTNKSALENFLGRIQEVTTHKLYTWPFSWLLQTPIVQPHLLFPDPAECLATSLVISSSLWGLTVCLCCKVRLSHNYSPADYFDGTSPFISSKSEPASCTEQFRSHHCKKENNTMNHVNLWWHQKGGAFWKISLLLVQAEMTHA